LSRRLTLQGERFTKVIGDGLAAERLRGKQQVPATKRLRNKKNANGCGWRLGVNQEQSQLMRVENSETASGHQRIHVAATEAQVGVGRKG
jgi:hypothetical protein